MNRLAVLILTYNEEENISDCINSVKFADEIIIVDSGSQDHTEEIAKDLGAKFIYNKMTGFADQRNFALNQTNAEWVLYLDADERILPDTAKEICNIVKAGIACAYEIKRMNIVFGQMLKHGGHRPDYALRLYPREAVKWQGIVHEQAIINIPIKRLNGAMHHYTYQDWDKYFVKFNQYTTLMAKKMKDSGKQANFLDISLRPLFAFFRFYFLQSGWRDGKMGFVFAMFHCFYTLAKYVKLYYWQEGRGNLE